jgi:hypothetical protein
VASHAASWIQPAQPVALKMPAYSAEFNASGPPAPAIWETGAIRVTIDSMILAIIAIRVLEAMFFLGLIGSSIVVLISFVEDGKELFGKDE